MQFITTISSRKNRTRSRSKKILHWVQLRPAPPPITKINKLDKFKFRDEVEAFNKDGWWEGFIMEELATGKFIVFFRSSKEQILFGEKKFRMQWYPKQEN
ncbi:Protein AGENET DOMAIN (AGD)-CONTAINING P1 [Linum perenne]